jgi:hypothetical protein
MYSVNSKDISVISHFIQDFSSFNKQSAKHLTSVTSCFFNKLLLWPASHQICSEQISAVPNSPMIGYHRPAFSAGFAAKRLDFFVLTEKGTTHCSVCVCQLLYRSTLFAMGSQGECLSLSC